MGNTETAKETLVCVFQSNCRRTERYSETRSTLHAQQHLLRRKRQFLCFFHSFFGIASHYYYIQAVLRKGWVD